MKMNINALWDEINKLRAKLIAKNECPHCEGYLLPEEWNGIHGYYRCCTCNRVWEYYGPLVSAPED